MLKKISLLKKKIYSELRSPPNILWLDKSKIVIFYRKNNFKYLFLIEITKQLITWIRKICKIGAYIKFQKKNKIPFHFLFKASLVNNFSLNEVNFWYKQNVNNWSDLVQIMPESLTKAFHYEKRLNWPKKCNESIKLLQEKSRMLLITPNKYRPKFYIINGYKNIDENFFRDHLEKNGLIFKPNIGSRGQHIYHIFRKGDQIIFKNLFSHKLEKKLNINDSINFVNEISSFKKRQNILSELIIMPYLKHSEDLPKTEISIVFRTISKCKLQNKAITIKEAWMEVFDKNNNLFIINHENYLFNPNNTGKNLEDLEEEFKFSFSNSNLKKIYKDLFQASIELHSILPPINEVAWDWIKTDNKLFLLEGNTSFCLYPIKYFKLKKTKLYLK